MSRPELLSSSPTSKLSSIQAWQDDTHRASSEPQSPASTNTRRHSVPSPRSPSYDVRVMPAPPVPQVHVHLAEPRPVLYHTHSHVASLHSWDGTHEDVESRAGLRSGDRDGQSTLSRDMSWRARAARMSRAFFGGNTPALPSWPPLNVEKHPQPLQNDSTVNVHVRADSEAGHSHHKCTCKPKDPRRKRNRMCWCLLIILLILLAVGDIIFLNVRVLNPYFISPQPPAAPAPTNLSRVTSTFAAPTVTITSAGSTIISVSTPTAATSTSASPGASATPSVLETCLSQFQINAPSNPESFPCDTCFSALSSAPSSANAGSALQFCAMKAVFDSAGAGSTNSGALSGAGWMKDAKPCGWNGISCDSSGNINSITLTFPGVPAVMPSELSSISTLTSLKITGDGNLPAGSLPALNSLTSLDIENTALTAFGDDAFSSAKSLTSLTLVRNSKMGSALPSSVGSLSLKTLIVNGQSLTAFGPIFTSSSLTSSLRTLDLSSNSITASLPSDLSNMNALAELNLSANSISGAFPSAMPANLQVLNFEGNAKFSGSLPSSMCSSTALTQCDLKGTGLGDASTGCGSCVFA